MSLIVALALSVVDDPGCQVSASAERACVAYEELDKGRAELKRVFDGTIEAFRREDSRFRQDTFNRSDDRSYQRDLVAAQAAWETLVENECELAALATRPGTDEELNHIQCEIERVEQRTAYLAELPGRLSLPPLED